MTAVARKTPSPLVGEGGGGGSRGPLAFRACCVPAGSFGLSFPRTRESRSGGRRGGRVWIPACAGITNAKDSSENNRIGKRHCERQRSNPDQASAAGPQSGLLRFARNDGQSGNSLAVPKARLFHLQTPSSGACGATKESSARPPSLSLPHKGGGNRNAKSTRLSP